MESISKREEFPKISRYALILIFLYYGFWETIYISSKKYFIPLYHVELDCGTPRILPKKLNHVNIKLKLLPGKKTGKRKVPSQE